MPTIPFSDTAAATSDASGNITFTGFQQPRVGMWRTGSLSVVRSDGTAVVPSSVLPITWKAYVAKTIWGTWYNDQPSNLVQTAGPAVVVQGTNLAASAAYQCIFTGYDTDSPPVLSPLPAPAPPPSGFTTLVSGINNTNAIVGAGQYLNAAGSPTTGIVWFPVTVGTALEIAYFEADAGNIRLTPIWSTQGTPGSGVGTIHNADTFDLSFVSPNNVMQGMTYLNHGPFVTFFVQGTGASPRFVINTGLPPIVRPPSVSQGILKGTAGFVSIPSGENSFPLPPYVGSALIGGEFASAVANGIDIRIHSVDYLGTVLTEGPWAVSSQVIAGSSDNIPPTLVYLPPVINSLVVANRTAGPVNGSYYCIALGP